jgi:hypothetical protein
MRAAAVEAAFGFLDSRDDEVLIERVSMGGDLDSFCRRR